MAKKKQTNEHEIAEAPKVEVYEHQFNQINHENVELRCKINAIGTAVMERFDKDGTNDIHVPQKVTVWWVLTNLFPAAKLIQEIIKIVSNPCLQPVEPALTPAS